MSQAGQDELPELGSTSAQASFGARVRQLLYSLPAPFSRGSRPAAGFSRVQWRVIRGVVWGHGPLPLRTGSPAASSAACMLLRIARVELAVRLEGARRPFSPPRDEDAHQQQAGHGRPCALCLPTRLSSPLWLGSLAGLAPAGRCCADTSSRCVSCEQSPAALERGAAGLSDAGAEKNRCQGGDGLAGGGLCRTTPAAAHLLRPPGCFTLCSCCSSGRSSCFYSHFRAQCKHHLL